MSCVLQTYMKLERCTLSLHMGRGEVYEHYFGGALVQSEQTVECSHRLEEGATNEQLVNPAQLEILQTASGQQS